MSVKILSCTGLEFDAAIAAVKEGLDVGNGDCSTGSFLSRTQPNGDITISATTVVAHAFKACTEITSVTALNLQTIDNYAFARCTGLQSITFPNVETIGDDAFTLCSGLAEVTLPKVMALTNRQFVSCTGLAKVDLPKVTALNNKTFEGCNALTVLILRSATVCTLGSTNVFTNTPFAGYNGLTGIVYVPAALIESYKTATNWSTLYTAGTCNFVAIEGSEYE